MKKNNPRASFPTDAVSIPELPSESPEGLDLLVLQKQAGTFNMTIQELANLLLSGEIGTIKAFAYEGTLPPEYLACDGGAYQISSYPELFAKIEYMYSLGNPLPNGEFVVPDLHSADGRGYFLRQYTPVSMPVGITLQDTMRKIVGEFRPSSTNNYKTGAFVFSEKDSDINLQGGGGNLDTVKAIFDSAYGIEGQEGVLSPNVGSETAPASMCVKFGIRAKAFVDGTLAEKLRIENEKRN